MLNGVFGSFRIDLPEVSKVATPSKSIPVFSDTSFLSAFKAVALANTATVSSAPVFQAQPILPQLSPIVQTSNKKILGGFPIYTQGKNQCGPTTACNLLSYYQHLYKGTDSRWNHVNLTTNYFKSIGQSDTIGHDPLSLKDMINDICRKAGISMDIRQENMSTTSGDPAQRIRDLIDAGIPPILTGIVGGGSPSSLENIVKNSSKGHWLMVVGYEKTALGTTYYIQDPNSKTQTPTTMSSSQLMTFWNNNLVPGGHRYLMAAAPTGSYQDTCLKKLYPAGDKITSTFANTLTAVNALYDLFYKVEKEGGDASAAVESAADRVADAAQKGADAIKQAINDAEDAMKSVGDALANAGDDIANAASSAWDSIFG